MGLTTCTVAVTAAVFARIKWIWLRWLCWFLVLLVPTVALGAVACIAFMRQYHARAWEAIPSLTGLIAVNSAVFVLAFSYSIFALTGTPARASKWRLLTLVKLLLGLLAHSPAV